MRASLIPSVWGPGDDAAARGRWVRWGEIAALSALPAVVTLTLLDRERSVTYGAWLALVPALIGLKHGLTAALVATLIWGGAASLGAHGVTSLTQLLPFAAVALVAGQFRDHWLVSRDRFRRQAEEQQAQLEQLFRAFGSLRMSHAQLEERLAADSWSLESALRQAEAQVGERSLEGAASALLELLATQARVTGASIYLGPGVQPPLRAQGWLGPSARVDGAHPLVRAAWQRGKMMSFEPGTETSGQEQLVLLALPILTSRGKRVGVVAIHALPFIACNEAQFNLIATLVARLSDALASKLGVATEVPAPRVGRTLVARTPNDRMSAGKPAFSLPPLLFKPPITDDAPPAPGGGAPVRKKPAAQDEPTAQL